MPLKEYLSNLGAAHPRLHQPGCSANRLPGGPAEGFTDWGDQLPQCDAHGLGGVLTQLLQGAGKGPP